MTQHRSHSCPTLIARAPTRLILSGTGTDHPAYYQAFDSTLISVAINRYVYAIISAATTDTVQVISADYQDLYQQPVGKGPYWNWNGNMTLVRAILRELGIRQGLDVFVASQAPPHTGLGLSGALAVSMTAALSAWLETTDGTLDRDKIAELAHSIRSDNLGTLSGQQDPYVSAFGGLNEIKLDATGIRARSLAIRPETLKMLHRNLILFFAMPYSVAVTRHPVQHPLQMEQQPCSKAIAQLHVLQELSETLREALLADDLDAFGLLLHYSWLNRRYLMPWVSNEMIDACYAAARTEGAVGGTFTGAEGGGFMLLYCPEPYQASVTNGMQQAGLQRIDFAFDLGGVQILQPEFRSSQIKKNILLIEQ